MPTTHAVGEKENILTRLQMKTTLATTRPHALTTHGKDPRDGWFGLASTSILRYTDYALCMPRDSGPVTMLVNKSINRKPKVKATML